MVNIAVPELYEQSFAGTKRLIERYVADQALSIRYLMSLRTDQPHRTGFSAQQKLDFIRGARQGLGRSTLLFQGGSVSGLCHIGVARVLYNQRLLPRVITGTSTGAFVAALICVKRRHELEAFFRDNVIDLESYRRRPRQSQFRLLRLFSREAGYGWCHTMFRRTIRYVNDRYLRDHNILQECARSDIGDMTFEEAYRRTKRVLNITVAMSKSGGTPVLFNYLTTPHVVSIRFVSLLGKTKLTVF